jgi:hypothetical protein
MCKLFNKKHMDDVCYSNITSYIEINPTLTRFQEHKPSIVHSQAEWVHISLLFKRVIKP